MNMNIVKFSQWVFPYTCTRIQYSNIFNICGFDHRRSHTCQSSLQIPFHLFLVNSGQQAAIRCKELAVMVQWWLPCHVCCGLFPSTAFTLASYTSSSSSTSSSTLAFKSHINYALAEASQAGHLFVCEQITIQNSTHLGICPLNICVWLYGLNLVKFPVHKCLHYVKCHNWITGCIGYLKPN